ncbi:general transcription repressor [Kappamyces sp. JEL0680]|nr:general transcription repressor [Kappamyces sp. JEL0680]
MQLTARALVDETIPKDSDLYIRSVCFSPDGVYLATGAEDHVIRIWDIVNGRVKLKLNGHSQDIYSLDWTKDGKSIVSGSGDHTVKASLDEMIRVWDLRTGYLLERFEGHQNSVYSVAFSPDGLSIVSGSLDQSLRLWDLSPATLAVLSAPPSERRPEVVVTTKHRHSFLGHRDYVLSVGYPGAHSTIGRVDPSGRPIQDPTFDIEWIVSGSKDRHVIFWDAKDGLSNGAEPSQSQPLLTMSGHKNSGGLLATGSGDLKARIWRVSRVLPASAPQPTAAPHQPASLGVHQVTPIPPFDRRKSVAGSVPSPRAGAVPSPHIGSTQPSAPSSAPHVGAQSPVARPQTLGPVLALPVVKPVASQLADASGPTQNPTLSPSSPPKSSLGISNGASSPKVRQEAPPAASADLMDTDE